jgi:chloramphenicol 3-O-phosphotransferase
VSRIDLSGNVFADQGVEVIADAIIDNPGVLEIFLGMNGIGVVGARAIARLIEKNEIIQTIDLSGYNFKESKRLIGLGMQE